MTVEAYLDHLIERYPVLEGQKDHVRGMYEILRDSYRNGGKLLIGGNGGSASDAEHITGELMKGFVKKRPVPDALRKSLCEVSPEIGEKLADRIQMGLPTIALDGHPALTTAFLNDVDGSLGFAQQVCGYGKAGDVFLGISTSGNSGNVISAAVMAKALGMKVIGLLGRDGGKMLPLCDDAVVVPEQETYKIQELHLPVYHAVCLMLEEEFFEA